MKTMTAEPILTPALPAVRPRRPGRFLWLLASFALMVGIFLSFVRPYYQAWGATEAEQAIALPGDDLKHADYQATRAITINAPIRMVWPWLAQLGQDRGGFYSYDMLENVAGAHMPTSDQLRVGKQQWKAGDKLWMYPPSKGIAVTGAPLETFIKGRALGFATTKYTLGDSSWTFVLQPIDSGHTRFLIRDRGPYDRTLGSWAFTALVFDPAHFAMEKRTMFGIKQMAERGDRGHLSNWLQVSLWVVTFGLWVGSIVLVLRRQAWVRPLAGFLAASALFQILTLGQPSFWIGLPLVAGLVWLLWPPKGSPGTAAKAEIAPMPAA